MTEIDYMPEYAPEVQCDDCAALGNEPCEGWCRCDWCAPSEAAA